MTDLTSNDSTEEMCRASGMLLCKAMFKAYGVIGDKPEARAVVAHIVALEKAFNNTQAAIASKQTCPPTTEMISNRPYIIEAQAEQIRKLEEEIKELNEIIDEQGTCINEQHNRIAALQAKIDEANRKASAEADWFICSELPDGRLQYTQDKNDEEYAMQLFTRPPITPQRELELLAVIEQMREALIALTDICITQVGVDYNDAIHAAFLKGKEALALTSDITPRVSHSPSPNPETQSP